MSGLFGPDGPVVAALERIARDLERGIDPDPPLERLARRPPITIVIPVYDAADALRRCVASIRRDHGADDEPELILVDDHSRPAAERACHELAEGWPRTRVLRNERNLGFVGTVNRGMQAATPHHDVLLLNSDTIVSRGWLAGLGVTAHLDESIGTVCPLSNAAGVFSTPVAYEDGPLPDGFDVDMCQRVLELVSPRLDERVPTTSGFCMLIKRAVLDRIGYFDSMLFLRGYGEENDFNERASAAGFVHVVDDGRFVYHERAASFGAGKARLKEQNSRILKSVHPGHVEKTKAWLAQSRLDEVRRPYGRLMDALAQAPEPSRTSFFYGAGFQRRLFVATSAVSALEQQGIHVSYLGAARWRVNLFGVTQAELVGSNLPAILFTLGRRFGASILLGADAPEAGLVQAALARRRS